MSPNDVTFLDCAKLAQSAYTDTPKWKVGDRNRACLSIVGDVAIISIPGTDPREIEDLWTDGDCDPVWVRGLGLVHDGFSKRGLALYELLRVSIPSNVSHVVFVGHSLGGAVAICLAALWVRDKISCTCSFVTFGAPRVGTAFLAYLLKGTPGKMFRFGRDPIPSVPSFWLFHLPPVWYAHPKLLTQVGTPGELLIEDNHLMVNYLKVIPNTPLEAA